ncbi:MAG: FmdE family protein [Berryella intestinalis]|uniref:FmdE family protein n=1 Tax=Berryella intestinalis TaxID=1531429 RepID=UPI002A533D84|nr:FmdE family protein [Berryella intestinalis]MDD7368919.1 FmdE family protein [Berryella intestinalis]MDY3128514.1 FmdE family protein [Berryella intestinalis]
MLSADLWEKAARFHGHKCPGLAMGFKACEGAVAQLGLSEGDSSVDEELVCVVENDACGVDAVQALLGCTYGKGNLIPRLRGKMAFSFFSRESGRSVRLCLKPGCGDGMDRAAFQDYLVSTPYEQLFDIGTPSYGLPESARIFRSQRCSVCGEKTAEYALRLQDGKPVCLDCYDPYEREGF